MLLNLLFQKLRRLFFPISVRVTLSADTKVQQILGNLIDPLLETSVFIQLCPYFDWDKFTFIHSSWYSAVVGFRMRTILIRN